MKSLITDYLVSIYSRYSFYNSTPYITQLSPTEKNIEGFEIWIHKREEFFDEPYFMETKIDYAEVRRRVANHFLDSNKFGKGNTDDSVSVNILEV